MKIEHFKKLDNAGSLKAFFHVICKPTGLWHYNISLFQKAGGQTWFGYPSRSYVNKEGLKKFFRQAYPDDQDRPEFEQIMKEYLLANYPVTRDILSDHGSIQNEYNPTTSNLENLPF